MNPERWQQISHLYDAALACDGVQRAAFLRDACAGDLALRRDVEALLAQQASGFLDAPAVAAAPATVSDAGDSLLTGRRLGAYQVHMRIGVGGMGEVYRARDTKLGRDVAIKILPKLFTSDPDRLARFEREARVLASLNHPHIGAIYGVEDADGVQALVLELVDGDTLAERIAHGPISVNDTLTIARQIAQALEAAHEKGIIHRDLKPANIKITPHGVVKVLDFGLARIVNASDGSPSDSRSPTITIEGTREGLVMGTAAYMSPEQAQGKTVDGRSDVFSLGVLIYELLTCRPPFSGTTMVETLAKILETRPADLRTFRNDLPEPLALLVEACLEKDRQRRPSAHDVGHRLAAIEQSQTVASAGLGAVLRRRAVLIPAVIVALAVIAAGGAWWASGREARAARGRVPELLQLAGRYDYDGFYREARSVVPLLPDDLQIAFLSGDIHRHEVYEVQIGGGRVARAAHLSSRLNPHFLDMARRLREPRVQAVIRVPAEAPLPFNRANEAFVGYPSERTVLFDGLRALMEREMIQGLGDEVLTYCSKYRAHNSIRPPACDIQQCSRIVEELVDVRIREDLHPVRAQYRVERPGRYTLRTTVSIDTTGAAPRRSWRLNIAYRRSDNGAIFFTHDYALTNNEFRF